MSSIKQALRLAKSMIYQAAGFADTIPASLFSPVLRLAGPRFAKCETDSHPYDIYLVYAVLDDELQRSTEAGIEIGPTSTKMFAGDSPLCVEVELSE